MRYPQKKPNSLVSSVLILSMTLVVFQPAWAATFSSLPAAPTEEQSAQGTGEINEETTEHLINSLAGREYQVTWQDKDYQGDDFATGKWHFANRANNLRAYFDESGFEMMPRVISPNEPAPWNFKYSPLTLQRENDNQPQALNQVTNLLAEDNKIIATRGEGVEEWYLNTPAGLEHGFNLQNRPAGDGPVILKGNITTDLEATLVDNNKITFQQNGKLILSYEKLKVIDNEGTELPVRLELEKEGDSNTYQLNFFFDDTNAVYPIIIDPLLDSSWQAESNQASAQFGRVVDSAGDVNGDNYDDIIVGAYKYDNGQTDEGAVFVWYGSATGLGDNGTTTNADWQAESNQASAQFGHSVASAGDVNGDNYDDIIVGASIYDKGQTNEGAVFVWYGSETGLGESGTPANADWQAESNQAEAYLGNPVASAGDVNNDNYDDIIVGASNYDNVESNEGGVFVWYGSATGLGESGTPANADWQAESNQATAYFGNSVASAGDVNGDNYDDIIVGASIYGNVESNEGVVFVWYGSATGLGESGTPANADWQAESNQAEAYLGNPVASAGDVNGDNYDDIIVGAYNYDNVESNEGGVFVWYGSATGLGESGTPANADWQAESNQASANLGRSVASAGDVNNDNYDDIIVGASNYDNVESNEGGVFVWYGSATGLGESGTPANADWQAESNQATAYLGYSVASAGDVNNDGYDEVIVGAYYYDNVESNEGAVFVFSEPPTPSAFSPASGTTINNTTPTITFSLNKNGDCKCSLTDQAYGEMETDCSGDGTKNISCPVPDLGLDGAKTVYISCKDTMNSADNSETNEHLSYTLDTTPPSVSLYSPANDTTDVSLTTDLELTFDEAVNVDAGNIVIYKSSDDSVIETIDVTSDQVSGSGTAVITINPTTDFSYETKYYIQIDPGALVDAINNSYSGITEATTWTFTTEDVPICPVVAHALTYSAYPTCNPTSCESGYVLSGGVCVSVGGGGYIPLPSLGHGALTEYIPMHQTKYIAQIKTQGTNILGYIGSAAVFDILLSKTSKLEEHSLTVLDLDMSNGEIKLLIKPNPVEIKLGRGEMINVDLDNDRLNDFSLVYNNLLVNRVDLTIIQLNSPASQPGAYPENSLLKERGQSAVYLIQENRKRLFFNAEAFLINGYNWKDIQVVGDLSKILTGKVIYAKNSNQTGYQFSQDLKIGMTSEEVRELQRYLNTHGFVVTENGLGSPNNETNFFGRLTKAALIKFQQANKINPAIGYFGPITRAAIN